jgi:hypothetical protein
MKRINIISETIYKGQQKLVNQGAFINFSDLINDIFACNGLTCACNGNNLQKSDYFIRKSALIYSRKKPGANWTSLEKIVKDVYNCCAGTTLCPSKKEQWWITTDVIRPRKTVETINFTNIIIKVLTCCEILNCCAPVSSPYNFDLTMDWSILLDNSLNPYPVTNQATFQQWLTNGYDSLGNFSANDFTNIVITDFVKTGDRIQCNLTADATKFNLSYNTIVNVEKIGVINGLRRLYLSFNQITTFNPSIALSNSLEELYLANNQIVTFNPSIALPSSLIELYLSFNQIVDFNPSIALPVSLQFLFLSSNQMTTAGYTASEPWANAQPSFAGTCSVNLTGNVNSVTGTNLEAILLTKNCTIIP